jgi:RsiW-degrading membrane proteinase PrsW (M82 family)
LRDREDPYDHRVPRWLKVWLLVAALTGATLLLVQLTDERSIVPGAAFLGALAGPMAFAVWVTDRTRIGRSVAPDVLFMSWLVGGGVAMLFAGFFQPGVWFHPRGYAFLWVALTEEIAKLLLPVSIYVVASRYRSVEQALTFAIVSAAGFATFESMAFAIAAVDHDSVRAARRVLFERSLVTPFGHLPWTGIAVVVATTRWQITRRIRPTPRALWGLGAVIVLHTTWNVAIVKSGWWWIGAPIAATLTIVLFRWLLRTVYYAGPYIIPADRPGRPPR